MTTEILSFTPMEQTEATRLLRHFGVAPEIVMVERMMKAADRMSASLACQPRGLPAGLEPSSAFSVRT